jgi:phosphoribosylamine--glycine ligase
MPTLNGIKKENFNYKGVIYFGLMITKDGPKVLEYNVRFGDPETQVILPSFKGDLLKLVLSALNGTLKDFQMDFTTDYYVNVVLASGGYPKSYEKGYQISGLDTLDKDTLVFHAGTKIDDEGKTITNGGRVLSIVAKDKTLSKAIEKVYNEVKKINFKNIYYRTDIGKRQK